MDYQKIRTWMTAHQESLIAFVQRLVQTPSMSGQEGAVAALVRAEMESLGYDRVWVDEVGNVIGLIEGDDGPALMFNGHMDQVATGDPASWPHPPFGGELHDGELWGRGACDMKGALASMVYAGAAVKALGQVPPGPLYVTGVVQEEVGGLGARHLSRTLPVQRVLVGEASANHLRRGHRGRAELDVILEGRSVHASMPELGINPHTSMARFIGALGDLAMASDASYGASSVAPTRISSGPESANVTPAWVHLVLDWRNIPGEGPAEILSILQGLVAASLEPGCQGRIEVASKALTSYTGVQETYPDVFPSFTTNADHPWLLQSQQTLQSALGREAHIGVWRFATDGGHFAAAGMEVIGFGPGDDRLVHTVQERIGIDELLESVVGYVALALQ